MRDPDAVAARGRGRGRGLPPGGDGRPRRRPRRHRRLRRPQRPRHGACCCARSPRAIRRAARARVEHGRLRRGPLPLRASTGSSGPGRARPPSLDAGQLRAAVPGLRRARLRAEVGAGGRAAGPAQRLRRDQGGAGAPVRARSRARPGAPVTALRYHNVYGPRMPRDTPYAGVASIFRSALAAGQAPRVFEDGGQRRDFVHVRDVARANVPRAATSRVAGAFNVALAARRARWGTWRAALARAIDGAPHRSMTGEWRGGRRAPRRSRQPTRAARRARLRARRGLRGRDARVRGREAARMTRFAVVGHVEWIEFGRFTPRARAGRDHRRDRVVLRGRRQRRGRRRAAREALGGDVDFFTALGDDERGRRRRGATARARRARPRRAARRHAALGLRPPRRRRRAHDLDRRRAARAARRRRPAVGAARRRRRRLRLRRRRRRDARTPAARELLVATPRAARSLAGIQIDALVGSAARTGSSRSTPRRWTPRRT